MEKPLTTPKERLIAHAEYDGPPLLAEWREIAADIKAVLRYDRPRLRVDFEYNHAMGMFEACLENGARFPVPRQQVAGKLSNALELFMRGVINSNSGTWARPKTSREIAYDYDESQVRKFTKAGRPDLALEDLDLDLSDLIGE